MLRLAVPAGAVLAALAFLTTPAAAAMTLAVAIDPARIAPNQESRAMEAVVTVDCTSVRARTVTAASAPVTLAFSNPSTVLLTGATVGQFMADDCPAGAETAELRMPYVVAVTHEAPGLVPLQVPVQASLESHSADLALGGLPQANATFAVTPAAQLASEAQSPAKLKPCGCPVTFDIDVTNFGNVRTRYEFTLDSRPAMPLPDEAFVLPEPFELAPSTVGSTSTGTAKVVFQAPADTWSGEAVFTVLVHSSAVGDPATTGAPLSVSMLVRNADAPSALDKATPGLHGPALAVGLVCLAAFAARRRA
jgi:hypothetical protein